MNYNKNEAISEPNSIDPSKCRIKCVNSDDFNEQLFKITKLFRVNKIMNKKVHTLIYVNYHTNAEIKYRKQQLF